MRALPINEAEVIIETFLDPVLPVIKITEDCYVEISRPCSIS